MSMCLYDNPETMRREAWKDGVLLCGISAYALTNRGFNAGTMDTLVGLRLPFILNEGPWKTGKFHYGDISAMSGAEQKAGRESE